MDTSRIPNLGAEVDHDKRHGEDGEARAARVLAGIQGRSCAVVAGAAAAGRLGREGGAGPWGRAGVVAPLGTRAARPGPVARLESPAARAQGVAARVGDHPAGARLPKKSCGVLREGRAVRYACIAQHVDEFQVRPMCRMLEVSPSGFYAW